MRYEWDLKKNEWLKAEKRYLLRKDPFPLGQRRRMEDCGSSSLAALRIKRYTLGALNPNLS